MSDIKVARLKPHAKFPTLASDGSAGWDLYACIDEPTTIVSWMPIGTGIAIELPVGVVGLVCPRSGLALARGLTTLNGPGIIDSDFRGEVCVILTCRGSPTIVSPGDRVGQLVIVRTYGRLVEADFAELTSTSRGHRGFGSTGY